MIEDISTPKDVIKEEQVNTCDICNKEINTIKYLNVTSSNIKKVQGISSEEEGNKNNNNYDNDNGEYYNICLNCADKIVELMRYNHGFEGRLIQFLESLKNEK